MALVKVGQQILPDGSTNLIELLLKEALEQGLIFTPSNLEPTILFMPLASSESTTPPN